MRICGFVLRRWSLFMEILSQSSLSCAHAAAVTMITLYRMCRVFGVSHAFPFNRRASVECKKINKTASHGFCRCVGCRYRRHPMPRMERERKLLVSCMHRLRKRNKSESNMISIQSAALMWNKSCVSLHEMFQ